MAIYKKMFGDRRLVFLIVMSFAALVTGNMAVVGDAVNIAEIWSVAIPDVTRSVSVSESGKVVIITDGTNLQVYSDQGELEKYWIPPTGSYFEFCLVRQEYVLGTHGDVVFLLANGGSEQLWAKSLRDLWPDAVAMSIESRRIVVASLPPSGKSTIWMLEMEGNVVWNREIESNVTDTAITPEGFVIAGGERYGYLADKGRHAVYLFRPNGSLAWWEESDSPVIDVAVSDDCTRIVAGLDDGGMLLLDGDGRVVWEKEVIGAWVDISGDGQCIVASSLNGLVMLGIDGSIIWQSDALGYLPGSQDGLEISRNGKTIVGFTAPSIYEGNRVCVFDRGGDILYSVTNSTTAPRVAVSENGQFVAIAFGRKLILLQRT